MSAICENISARETAGLFVNMHFDYTDDCIEITTARDALAKLIVRPRVRDHIFIRVPGWAPRESVEIDLDGNRLLELQTVGSYVYLDRKLVPAGSEILMRHALPVVRRTVETMAAGDTYQFAWRGMQSPGSTRMKIRWRSTRHSRYREESVLIC